MSQAAELNVFLAGVEKRAWHMARYEVRNDDDALDIVQDTMFTLARKYADRPVDEWPALFFTILRSRITDHQRRGTFRERFFGWARSKTADEVDDTMAGLADEGVVDPLDQLSIACDVEALDAAIANLPERQRQVFLLRHVEALSVADTAAAMQCSEGTVKTHLSRALASLRQQLENPAS